MALLARLRRERAGRGGFGGHRGHGLAGLRRNRPGGHDGRHGLGKGKGLRRANRFTAGVQRYHLPFVFAPPGQRFGVLVAQGGRRDEGNHLPTRREDLQAIRAGPRLVIPQKTDQPLYR